MRNSDNGPEGPGTGRSLPPGILIACSLSTLFSTLFSFWLIWRQLKNYRKPNLQRYVVRLLVMVPIYSVASCISLFSLNAAFVIDLVRDLYEAFVIYCFFNLLVEYLGGERSLIILLHGRQPTPHPWPFGLFLKPMDASDPFTFLALKRGILQYVQIKPVLAVITVVCKAFDIYDDGKIALKNGYTWVSFTYNFSVFLSLYCLVMFWSALSKDLKPFRVTWKFLVVKGLIFLTFWQGLAISILVAIGLLKSVGPVGDPEFMSLAVQDMLICFEMPLFALAHACAFSHKDYIDAFATHAARLPVFYAARDAIGIYDVWTDSITTIRGTGYGYQTFEPSEGAVHAELARTRRYKAGLRYAEGGRVKYWLPQRTSGDTTEVPGERHRSPLTRFKRYLNQKRMEQAGYAPLLPEEAAEIVHSDPDLENAGAEGSRRDSSEQGDEDESRFHRATAKINTAMRVVDQVLLPMIDEDSPASLEFEEPESEEEQLYDKSRALLGGGIGDWGFPTVDPKKDKRRKEDAEAKKDEAQRRKEIKRRREAQAEAAKKAAHESSENEDSTPAGPKVRVGKRGRSRKWSKSRFSSYADGSDADSAGDEAQAESSKQVNKKDAQAESPRASTESQQSAGAVDLLIEDHEAEERERVRERRRGDPALRATQKRIFRKMWDGSQNLAIAATSQLTSKGSSDSTVHKADMLYEPSIDEEALAAQVEAAREEWARVEEARAEEEGEGGDSPKKLYEEATEAADREDLQKHAGEESSKTPVQIQEADDSYMVAKEVKVEGQLNISPATESGSRANTHGKAAGTDEDKEIWHDRGAGGDSWHHHGKSAHE